MLMVVRCPLAQWVHVFGPNQISAANHGAYSIGAVVWTQKSGPGTCLLAPVAGRAPLFRRFWRCVPPPKGANNVNADNSTTQARFLPRRRLLAVRIYPAGRVVRTFSASAG